MASGDTLSRFDAVSGRPTASNAATLFSRNTTDPHDVLNFDATTNQSTLFRDVLDRAYAGSGLTVYIHYSMASAETGTVEWDVEFERIGDQQQDTDTSSFATAQSLSETVPGTAGLVSIMAIAFTNGAQIDSIAVGEIFRIRVTRDAVTDSAALNAELHFVEIKET